MNYQLRNDRGEVVANFLELQPASDAAREKSLHLYHVVGNLPRWVWSPGYDCNGRKLRQEGR